MFMLFERKEVLEETVVKHILGMYIDEQQANPGNARATPKFHAIIDLNLARLTTYLHTSYIHSCFKLGSKQ